MYQILSILVYLLIIFWFIWGLHKKRYSITGVRSFFLNHLADFLHLFSSPENDRQHSLHIIRRFLLISNGLLFASLLLTGFIPVIFFGHHLSGWLLIIHVTIAPFFIFILALTALLFAWQKFFDKKDLTFLSSMGDKRQVQAADRFVSKLSFWLFLFFSLPAVLSIVLSMYPLFGTEGLEYLLFMHQYSVLILLMIVAVYLLVKFSAAGAEEE